MNTWPETSSWSYKVCIKCKPRILELYRKEAKHLNKDEQWMWWRIEYDWKHAMVDTCEHFEMESCPYFLVHVIGECEI